VSLLELLYFSKGVKPAKQLKVKCPSGSQIVVRESTKATKMDENRIPCARV
jgi:hypothetical protein